MIGGGVAIACAAIVHSSDKTLWRPRSPGFLRQIKQRCQTPVSAPHPPLMWQAVNPIFDLEAPHGPATVINQKECQHEFSDSTGWSVAG